MKKYILTIALIVFVLGSIKAQPLGPDSPVPFGAIELLLLAGAGYGAKKTYDKNKEV